MVGNVDRMDSVDSLVSVLLGLLDHDAKTVRVLIVFHANTTTFLILFLQVRMLVQVSHVETVVLVNQSMETHFNVSVHLVSRALTARFVSVLD